LRVPHKIVRRGNKRDLLKSNVRGRNMFRLFFYPRERFKGTIS
jgi:hypothetical protein